MTEYDHWMDAEQEFRNTYQKARRSRLEAAEQMAKSDRWHHRWLVIDRIWLGCLGVWDVLNAAMVVVRPDHWARFGYFLLILGLTVVQIISMHISKRMWKSGIAFWRESISQWDDLIADIERDAKELGVEL